MFKQPSFKWFLIYYETVQYKRIFFLSKYVYVRTPFDIDDNFSGLESYAMSGNIFTKRVRLVF